MTLHTRTLVAGLALTLAVAAAPAPALAQAASASAKDYPAACVSVSPTQSEKAHDLYKAGKVQYDDNDWDAAIATFRDAYARDCSKHELLIIISRAYELKGDRPAAVRALEIYLEREPKSPEAETYKRRIAKLKEEIAKSAASPPPVTKPPPPLPSAASPVAASSAPSSPADSPPAPTESRGHTAGPWIVVGVGAAAVVTGVVLLVAAPDLPEGCNPATRTCVERPNETTADRRDREATAGLSQGMPLAGGIVAGAGGGIVALGLLWHFLEPTGPAPAAAASAGAGHGMSRASGPKLTPHVGPGYAGFVLGSRFW